MGACQAATNVSEVVSALGASDFCKLTAFQLDRALQARSLGESTYTEPPVSYLLGCPSNACLCEHSTLLHLPFDHYMYTTTLTEL